MNAAPTEDALVTSQASASAFAPIALAFSIAAYLSADILLMDEVLEMGDLEFQKRAVKKMIERKKEGKAILFVSQIGASLTSLYSNPANQPSVGVSGALFGLFAATAVISKRYGLDTRQIYVIVGINFAIGFVLPGIDWRAHLGGLVTGFIFTNILLAPTRR